MWKQVNYLINQLSPAPSKKRVSNEIDRASVELSVREPRTEQSAVELRSIKASSGKHACRDGSDVRPTNGHALTAKDRAAPPAQLQAEATTAPTEGLQPQRLQHSQGSESSDLLSPDAVLRRVKLQDWANQAPCGARLLISICCELAQRHPLEQLLLAKLQQCAVSGTWKFLLCSESVLRLVLDQYCPEAVAAGAGRSCAQPQIQPPQLPQQTDTLSAQLATALAAAAAELQSSCASSGDGSPSSDDLRLQQLESLIVHGEAHLLQRHEQSWACLLQLAGQDCCRQPGQVQQAQPVTRPQSVTQPQSSASDSLEAQASIAPTWTELLDEQLPVQQSVSTVWPVMHAWVGAVLGACRAASPTHQPTRPAGSSTQQLLPNGWDELLAALKGLQQEVQEALPAPSQPVVEDPLQACSAGVTPTPALTDGPNGSNLSASATPAAAGLTALQLRQQEMLQELCPTVPALLQSADLQTLLQADGVCPNTMALVVLLRLAASTSSLWLPLLSAGSSAAPAVSPDSQEVSSCKQDHHLDLQLPEMLPQAQPSAAMVPQETTTDQQQAATGDDRSSSTDAAPGSSSSDVKSPRSSWPDELLSSAQLWAPSEEETEEDAAAITREERTLRCWINSVLHRLAGSSSGGGAAAAVTGGHPLLGHSYSVDSGIAAGFVQGQLQPGDAVNGVGQCPVRWNSLGGCSSAPVRAAVQPGAPLGTAGVFRSVSGGVAAAAAQIGSADGCSGSPGHSRSISADACGTSADLSLKGWAGEPAAPSGLTVGLSAHAAADVSAGGSSAAGEAGGSSVSSLFGAELRSGVLLLEILDLLQPGCVDWRLANRPPFPQRTAQLKALENCQLALKIAQEELGLPLVSMSPRDIVTGRRKIILSLVYQLMRFNTMQLLESISAAQHEQQAQQGASYKAPSTGKATAGSSSPPSTPSSTAAASHAESLRSTPHTVPPSGLLLPRASGSVLNIRSNSRKQRRQLAITEQDILNWANSKLLQVQPLTGTAAAAEVPVIRSFRDPVLSSGVVLLQLLHVMAPDLVDLSYVSPGHTALQRQSNARYALSLADKMGCSLFLVWEDLVPPQPRMVLVLLASLMYQDLQRQHYSSTLH